MTLETVNALIYENEIMIGYCRATECSDAVGYIKKRLEELLKLKSELLTEEQAILREGKMPDAPKSLTQKPE